MFLVTVNGQYIARSPNVNGEKIVKDYSIEVKLPTTNSLLSVIKNKLLHPALAMKYPDFVTYRTHHIASVRPLDPESAGNLPVGEIKFMTRPELLRFIKVNALAVDARYYPDLVKLREAVALANEDPEGYQRQFELRKEDLELNIVVAEANPELFNHDQPLGDETPDVPAPVAVKPPVKTAKGKAFARKTTERVNGLAADMARSNELGPVDEPRATDDL